MARKIDPVIQAAQRATRAATIRDLRERAQLSQLDVARELGISKQAVSEWERGDSPGPNIEHLGGLYDLLGRPTELLAAFGINVEPTPIADVAAAQLAELRALLDAFEAGTLRRPGDAPPPPARRRGR